MFASAVKIGQGIAAIAGAARTVPQEGRGTMRSKRLLGWVMVALGGLVASLVAVSTPATADTAPPPTIVVTTAGGNQADIHGPGLQIGGHDTLNTQPNSVGPYAGLRKGTFPDGTTAFAYCIHINAELVPPG